ncbi:DNA/RNA nuclease SfsA [Polycladidibacter hongkongensis]|uniref:DNA/RNA nuclease SfsA n=1 Tax=Polycladidibacter hongkongensis TaxID=1647556 RepID=UPI00083674D7|nr:DNA/RNA nuclease SfsA [Pseudovibrio hongkongensis]
MKFPEALIEGRLKKRYKRFLADVELCHSGEIVTAHCANSGSMKTLLGEGIPVWLSYSDDPKRKLKYSWQMLQLGEAMVGINTALPNKLVEEALGVGWIAPLQGYAKLRREVKYGKNSRIDILLENEDGALTYVEVKNTTMLREAGIAEFPDSVTARGTKHLQELSDMVAQGHRAAMVFLVQRDDAQRMRIARDIDHAYGEAFDAALAAGVEAYAIGCRLDAGEIVVDRNVEIDFYSAL